MLRRAVNEIEIQGEISTKGRSHLLIKDGRYGQQEKNVWSAGDKRLKESLPTAIPISRTPLHQLKGILCSGQGYEAISFYLPGSSLRGAWRSYLEKVLRSLDDIEKVCDPLVHEDQLAAAYEACSSVLVNDERPKPDYPYGVSCPVCRLFGNTAVGSRLAFSDAEKVAAVAEIVDNVAISRQTGSVISPFKSLALRAAKFKFTLRLRNFELWHVGLLAHLFDDLKDGRVSLGSGKNKGFGEITARATAINVTYYGKHDLLSGGKLLGIAETQGVDLSAYKLKSGEPPVIGTGPPLNQLWRHTRPVSDPSLFWAATKDCFNQDAWGALPELSARVGA